MFASFYENELDTTLELLFRNWDRYLPKTATYRHSKVFTAKGCAEQVQTEWSLNT